MVRRWQWPLPNVRQVVEYARRKSWASKIWLASPLQLRLAAPFVQGRTKAQSISPRRRWPGRSATGGYQYSGQAQAPGTAILMATA